MNMIEDVHLLQHASGVGFGHELYSKLLWPEIKSIALNIIIAYRNGTYSVSRPWCTMRMVGFNLTPAYGDWSSLSS